MKVILCDTMDTLGKIGDVVNVKDGYARNFLLPRGKAMLYSQNAFNVIEKKKKQEAARYAKDIENSKVLADKIASMSCTVKAQAGEDDKLYGSVTNIDIQSALEQEGVEVDKRNIIIDEPIKKLGIYSIKIKLLPEVETQLKVWVVRS
ncbi:MAG: 50S ribosomal protein L9 [Candidatus Omnitrophica bacterium]|nr:50S ribosomal protein L9 [Candidatus Omnitrophota bacterium]